MRTTRRRLRAAAVALSAVALLGVTACSEGSDAADDDDVTTSEEETTDEPTDEETDATDEETEEATDDESAGGAGSHPSWSLPPTTPGEKIATVEAGDVTVDIYQVAVDKAPEDGNFVDPETNKPILAKGDPIVVLNYVITNNGDPIQLGSSKVDVTAKYDDWKWLQGMDSVTDSELYEKHGVNEDRNAPGGLSEDGIYVLGSGETYSYGDNFKHQKGSPITFTVDYVPVDDAGDLLHDDKVEAEAKATIK